MSWDPYDYQSLSRSPLLRFGTGMLGRGGRPNPLADAINGLVMGGQGFLQGRQQAQQQAQQAQLAQQQSDLNAARLQGMNLDNQAAQQRIDQNARNPYVLAAGQAILQHPDNQALIQRQADIASGAYQVQPGQQARVVTDQSQLPPTATSVGTEGNMPAMPSNLFQGIDLSGPTATQQAQQQAIRNIIAKQLFADAPNMEHGASLLDAGQKVLDPNVKLGATVPAHVVTDQSQLLPTDTSIGFEGNVQPYLPPNTVDVAAAYNAAGKTKTQLQADAAAAKQQQVEAGKNQRANAALKGRMLAGMLSYNSKLDSNFRSGLLGMINAGATDPDAIASFLRQNQSSLPAGAADSLSAWLADPDMKTPMPNLFGSAGGQGAAPTPNLFPNGTKTGSQIGKNNADADAATKNAATRAQAEADAADYRKQLVGLRGRALDIQQQLGQGKLDLGQAQLAWNQQLAGYKAAYDQWENQNAAALQGPRANPLLTQQAIKLRQQMFQLGGRIGKLNDSGTAANLATAQALTKNFQDLDQQFNELVSRPAAPVATPTPPPQFPGGRVPALPVPPGAPNMNNNADPNARARYIARLKQNGASPAQINQLLKQRFGG